MNHNTCVLIMSCDKYQDLWNPFFHFFEKYWIDCPFPVYLASNTVTCNRKNVISLNSNKFTTWSDETLEILNQIPQQTIIYLQDDYLLQKKVSNLLIFDYIAKSQNYNADYLRLFPSPGPDLEFKNDPQLGKISNGANYRTSLQAAIWKKDTLKALIKKDENQWDFEMNSPGRSQNYLFLSVKKQNGNIKHHTYPITYYYLTGVLRGKWRWEAAKICRHEGIVLNSQIRKTETYFQFVSSRFYDGLPLFLKKYFDFVTSKFK